MARALQLARATVAPLTRTRAFRAVAPVALPPVERLVSWASRGRWQVSAVLVPSLVLRSTGARTSEPRETRLMYTPDGDGTPIVAGTSFARERHPAWTYNLLAHPEAVVSVRGRRSAVHAVLVSDASEREAAWARIEAQWPGYRAYERDSGREVRLFRLVRVGPAADRGLPA